MNTYRLNSIIVGIAFIIATGAGIAAAMIFNPLLEVPDYLNQIAANESGVLLGAFLTYLMSVACAGVGLGLYPILRKYSIGLAIGAVGFRLLESVTEFLGGLNDIALLTLSREFVNAGAPDASYFQTIGAIMRSGDEWLGNGVMLISWCIGAYMYYGIFYRYRLVPRWLSAWGLIGITLTVIASVLVMLGIIPGFGTVQMIANLPIIPQEIVFALWLIIKGVDLSTPASQAA